MHSTNLLIIDADSIHSRVLTRTLRQRGLSANSVRNGAAAIGAAISVRPDYVILEQQLGSDSGLGLISPLREINPAAKILVLTRFPSIQSAVRSIQLGAFNYLAKPAYIDEIMNALDISATGAAQDSKTGSASGKRNFDKLEWKHITAALCDHDGNISAAARALGMYRHTLQRKLEAHSVVTGKPVAAKTCKVAPARRRHTLRAAHAK